MAAMPGSPERFPRIALVGRHASPGLAAPLARLAAFLEKRGHAVVFEEETARSAGIGARAVAPAARIGETVDLAVVLGGDGTMLSIARHIAPFDVPLIGINQGRLGFLTDVPLAQMEDALGAMLDGRYVEESRTLLKATIERAGHPPASALALNDVVVNRGNSGSMIDVAVDIDGRFVFSLRADGLIVSTPTGTTAYALSAGGPIITPDVKALALVPVAPHALTHRPIAVAESAVIAIVIERGIDAAANCDGQAHFPLAENDRVTVQRAPYVSRFLHPEGHDHFATLRAKLHWSESPDSTAQAAPQVRTAARR